MSGVLRQIDQAQRIVEMAQAHLRSLLLLAAVERDGEACRYCRVPTIVDPEPSQRFLERTLDHIVPLSKGGKDELSNVCVCCRSCNARKGARPVQAYSVRVQP